MKRNVRLFLLYSIAWAICAIIIFFPFILGRKSLVIMDDGFNQYYPALAYLGNWYKELFRGNLILFDPLIGFGEDVIGCMSWYGFGDILLIPFCLVPTDLLDLSYTLSILFRLFLAGLFFLFAVDNDVPVFSKIAGAIMYSFCPYVFKHGINFLTFVTPMVWLPLITAGVKDAIKNKKHFSLKLILGVVFLAFSGFYFLYMTVVVFSVYLLVSFLVERRDSRIDTRELMRGTFGVIGTAMLGILCASVELVPLTIYFFQSPRVSAFRKSISSFWGFCHYTDVNIENIFFPRFNNIILNNEQYDFFKMPEIPVVFLLCMMFMINHRKNLEKKKLLWFSVLACFAIVSDGMAIIMNGFSIPYTRYYYCMFFVFAYVTAEMMPQLARSWNIVDSVCLLCVILMSILNNVITKTRDNAMHWSIIYIVVLIFVWAALLLKSRFSSFYIAFVAIAFTIMYGYLYNTPYEKGGAGFCGAAYWFHGPEQSVKSSELNNIVQTSKSDSFERYEIRGGAFDASLMLGASTTYSYYSMCNANVLSFLAEYGVSPSIQGSYIYNGLDGRRVLETLFSVHKYESGSYSNIVDNKYLLPLGIGYNKVISSSALDEYSQLEKQMLLSRMVTLDDKDYAAVVSSAPQLIALTGNYKDSLLEYEGIYISENLAEMVEGDVNETYLLLPDFWSEDRIDYQYGNRNLRILPLLEENYLPNYDRYINTTDFDFDLKKEMGLAEGKVLYVSDTNYDEVFEELNSNSMKNAIIEGNKIYGNVELNNAVMMLFSFPYSNGWKAQIDGEQAVIYRADNGLMALYVPEGRHRIELIYLTPGLKLGVVISCLGIVIFFMVLVLKDSWKRDLFNDQRTIL